MQNFTRRFRGNAAMPRNQRSGDAVPYWEGIRCSRSVRTVWAQRCECPEAGERSSRCGIASDLGTLRPVLGRAAELHGGALFMGRKNRQSLPLLYRLASQGWVCISASYRLRPAVTFPDHLIMPATTAPTRRRCSWRAVPPAASSPTSPRSPATSRFDRVHSIRFERVVDTVEDFAAWVRLREPLRPGR